MEIVGSTISGNSAEHDRVNGNNSSGYGEGIYNSGMLYIDSSSVSSNSVIAEGEGIKKHWDWTEYIDYWDWIKYGMGRGYGNGGGIFNSGTMYVNSSSISGNNVTGSGFGHNYGIGLGSGSGGGIYNQGILNLENSSVSGNKAKGLGYAPEMWPPLWGLDPIGEGTGTGGGIYNKGTLNLKRSSISGNYAEGWGSNTGAAGGGIYNAKGSIGLEDSSIFENSVSSFRGGGIGGDILNDGSVNLNNSSITRNSVGGSGFEAGGGIFDLGVITGNTSQVQDNRPDDISRSSWS